MLIHLAQMAAQVVCSACFVMTVSLVMPVNMLSLVRGARIARTLIVVRIVTVAAIRKTVFVA